MHGLSHEYLLQAILPTIQSSDSFSDGINIFALKESICEGTKFPLPFCLVQAVHCTQKRAYNY